MTNKLYVVSTPIGNLSEFTPRAIEVLKSVDFIACEDTRVTRKLCNLFEIDKPLFSCHEHNEFTVHQKIIEAIKDGKVVALVSDAGYPGISDPGSILIRKCIENSIDIEVISGPCALINALVSSGLDTTHFYYYGFLPSKKSERKKELKLLATREETMIFYEAPHRIVDTLEDMLDSFGERQISLSRELTKKHEQHIRGTISDVLSKLNEDELRFFKKQLLIAFFNFDSQEQTMLSTLNDNVIKLCDNILKEKEKNPPTLSLEHKKENVIGENDNCL
jgi:16S rRNA (cytidine1402-2'-O)-methyltransferase